MRLAVLGAGAVGRSVAELAADYDHTVTAVADSSGAAIDADGLDVAAVLERKERTGSVGGAAIDDVLEGPYDALVEATPTTLDDAEPGYSHAARALQRDQHVVLANKGPVAERYGDLQALVADSEGSLRFEATVGGAIPALATVEGVGAERVTGAKGVLNGTANFILTRMAAEGLDYDHVLAEAQDLGVAEPDPSFDVNGTDAALKCAILANVLYGGGYRLDDVAVEGIEELPGSALDVAAEAGWTVRLVGQVSSEAVRVGPRLVPEHGTLAVSGTQNIVQLETAHAGRLNLSGAGAGGPETASAVLADVDRLE